MFARQIGSIKANSEQHMGNCPTLIGEFGLPYDLDNGKAYRSGDFGLHARLLNLYYNALDTNLVNATQWNYTTDNDNRWGDHWNNEDLSIFSRDQQRDPSDINSGARGLEGFCRPFARRTAGTPTEIYIPCVQYPQGYEAELSSGEAERDEEAQLLLVHGAEVGTQRIVVKRRE